MPIISELRGLKQEDHEFKANLRYTENLFQNNNKNPPDSRFYNFLEFPKPSHQAYSIRGKCIGYATAK